jgi:hypothetical protein
MGLIAATGTAAVLSVFLSEIFVHSLPLFTIYVAVLTFTATYAGFLYPGFFYPLIIVNLLTLLARYQPSLWLILVVTGVILLWQLLNVPRYIPRVRRRLLIKSMQRLNALNKEVFSCFLQLDYPDNVYVFEKRLHTCKRRYLLVVRYLRSVEAISSGEKYSEKVDALFDIVMDLAQLRRRVSDHTVFGLCTSEMTEVSEEMSQLLLKIGKSKKIDVELFEEKIELFERNFNHVLKVAAREPVAFLLFIASLKMFAKECEGFV